MVVLEGTEVEVQGPGGTRVPMVVMLILQSTTASYATYASDFRPVIVSPGP